LRNPKEVEVEAIPELISDVAEGDFVEPLVPALVDDERTHGWRDPAWLAVQRFTVATGKMPNREELERIAA
jgi:hypothetical protein